MPRYKLIPTMQCNAQMKKRQQVTQLTRRATVHTHFVSVHIPYRLHIVTISWRTAVTSWLKTEPRKQFQFTHDSYSVVKCAAFYGINVRQEWRRRYRTISRCNIVRRNWINKWKSWNKYNFSRCYCKIVLCWYVDSLACRLRNYAK